MRNKHEDGSLSIIAVVIYCQITINGDHATVACKADYNFNFTRALRESIPFRWTVDVESGAHGNTHFGIAPAQAV